MGLRVRVRVGVGAHAHAHPPAHLRLPQAAHDHLHTAVLNMGSDGSLTVKSKDDVLRACQSARPSVE